MSASRQTVAVTTPEDAERWAVDADLHARVLQDLIAHPDAYDDLPNGCTLILVPDNDPAQAEWAIRRGAAAARRGASVYLRRTVVAQLPEVTPASPDELVGVRRIEFDPDGSVRRVNIKGDDGVWHEVQPTPEDAAGFPPPRNIRS